MTLQQTRARLVALSRRHSRVVDEAEDVAHDLILAALRRGIALDGDDFQRMAHAATRRHAAFLARSAARRRTRELWFPTEDRDDGPRWTPEDAADAAALPDALHTTLRLLVLGLDKAELRHALGVSDAALRKRFQALRAQAPLARPAVHVVTRTASLVALRAAQVRLVPHLAAHGPARVVAVSDPDGHGLIFSGALTPGRVTATEGAPHPPPRRHTKGPVC